MLIEIVSHCFASQLPHYAVALRYQLSSLVLHRPERCQVLATICFNAADSRTVAVVDWFVTHTDLAVKMISLPVPQLGRRAIGRNIAAKTTQADAVWFADVDQVWRDGCLDQLAELEWPKGAVMVYPQLIQIHYDHRTGDQVLADEGQGLVDIDPNQFTLKRYGRAIGGVQIVRGDFAREHGYLDGQPRWLQPAKQPFGDFRDDVAYRNFCRHYGRVQAVDLRWMYRLRHTKTTYQ